MITARVNFEGIHYFLVMPTAAMCSNDDNDKGPECTVCKGPCRKDHG